MIEVLSEPTKPATYPHRPLAMTDAQFNDAKNRYMSGENYDAIALSIGCNPGTLAARISRAGLPRLREQNRKEGRGQRTKDKIALISEQIVDQLAQKTPKSAGSLNLHADTLAKATKTAALVHGWSESGTVAIIVAGDLTSRAEEPAIEVEEVENEGESGTDLAPTEQDV